MMIYDVKLNLQFAQMFAFIILLHENANCVGIEVCIINDLHYDFWCLLFADRWASEGNKNCVTSVLKLAR